MSDTDDFVSGLREQYGDPGHDNSHPMAPWGGGLLEKGVEYGGAFARGAMKQAVLAPGLSHILPQAITDYAKEKDPVHPTAEGYGRYVTPTNMALAVLPDAPFLAAAKTAPWLARAASQVAQNAWKSTLGGAAQADTDTPSGDEAASRVLRGGAEGLGTSMAVTGGQAALRAVPRWMLPAAIAGAQMAHGGHYLWHDIRHALAESLAAIAARAARLPAGVVGAAGEAASQKGGYEAGGDQQESPEPF